MQVHEAELKDGLLSIELAREIPDEMKPRRIRIGGSNGQTATERLARNDSGERQAA
ncbi:MAG: hypothetical protein JWO25_50 [Alphaproteobacteria bacterium]|nr:hypothetical protein [Alphaproteobacteria bacterium]